MKYSGSFSKRTNFVLRECGPHIESVLLPSSPPMEASLQFFSLSNIIAKICNSDLLRISVFPIHNFKTTDLKR
jgi:hypothetical protein